MASFGGLLLVSEAYNWIPDFLGWGSTTWTTVTYLACSLVAKVSVLIPVSLLVSTVFVLSAMNRNQELAAARAAGIGMWRLTAPLWWVGVALAAVTVYAPQPVTRKDVITVAIIFGIINLPCISVWLLLGVKMRRFLTTPARLRGFNWTMAGLLLLSLAPIAALN